MFSPSIVCDVRDNFSSFPKNSFDVMLASDHTVESNCWSNLPPQLLFDVIRRLEESESQWPDHKDIVAFAAVCRSWRSMCKKIVRCPELCGKLTFPVSLKQPGPRDGTIKCFIQRDKSAMTFRLFLCLNPDVLVGNGKFLLSAERTQRFPYSEYTISMDAKNISQSSNTYIGKLRSNLRRTKFKMYDTHPPCTSAHASVPGRASQTFCSKKVSPKVPTRRHNSIARIKYDVVPPNTPRRMDCIMHSIPEHLPKSPSKEYEKGELKPMVLKNKAPHWHEKLQIWCLNFQGRVTVKSVKNFQLIAATESDGASGNKVIMQFGKVGKDVFTMDYRYPLSAFWAFAICLSSFDTQVAHEW